MVDLSKFLIVHLHFYSVHYIDENNWLDSYDRGILNMTTNGGNHWENQIGDTVELLTSVYFVYNNTGWAVGQNGTILKTTNIGDDRNKL